MSTSYKPGGCTSDSPCLIFGRAAATLASMKHVFGAVELRSFADAPGRLVRAEIRIEYTVVMLAGASPPDWPLVPSHVRLYVKDVDVIYRRALSAGVESMQEPV
jgi:PhnB protein